MCPPRLKCVITGRKRKEKEKEKNTSFSLFFLLLLILLLLFARRLGTTVISLHQMRRKNVCVVTFPSDCSIVVIVILFSCLGVMFLLHHEIFLIVIASYILRKGAMAQLGNLFIFIYLFSFSFSVSLGFIRNLK